MYIIRLLESLLGIESIILYKLISLDYTVVFIIIYGIAVAYSGSFSISCFLLKVKVNLYKDL